MDKQLRKQFNEHYTPEKYQNLVNYFNEKHPNTLGFRLSESPIFLTKEFGDKLIDVSESIIDQILTDGIMEDDSAIPKDLRVPNPIDKPHFLAIDFGICRNEKGEIEPQLIELQAFPSLFFYQQKLEEKVRDFYDIPDELSVTPNHSFDEKFYRENLKKLIVNDQRKENVILLELYPDRQKTQVDFAFTQDALGIETVCLSELYKENEDLYYIHDGVQYPVYRIYNRVIFDELKEHKELNSRFNITDKVDVDWVTHPDWFFKISKYILPKLQHQYIPKSYYAKDFPKNESLENYVLKPLFSFAGKGVIINPTRDDLDSLENPSNYILQEKVEYAPIFEDINGDFSKAEIRMMYVWHPNQARPELVINLVRMTKSEKVNVDQVGKEQIWTGSSIAFFKTTE